MAHTAHFTFNSFQTGCYIIWDESGKCTLIDPGCSAPEEISQIKNFITAKGLTPVCIMLTHAHFDHIFGVSEISRTYGIPVYMHPKERFTMEGNGPSCRMFGMSEPEGFETIDVAHGDTVAVGDMKFEVIETPGHTVGGVCYLEREAKLIATGDTIFAGTIGRSDLPGGDYDVLMRSIFEKLLMLEGDTRILPGHGPSSDISTERMTNPFLLPFNEPAEI